MPELVLSSSPMNKAANSPSYEVNKFVDKDVTNALNEGSDVGQVIDSSGKGFNSIFQGMVQAPSAQEGAEQLVLDTTELRANLNLIAEQAHLLELDPALLGQLQALIDGKDLSSLTENGAGLPAFFEELEALLADLYQNLEQLEIDSPAMNPSALADTIQSLSVQLTNPVAGSLFKNSTAPTGEQSSWQNYSYSQASIQQANVNGQQLTSPANFNLMDLMPQQTEADNAFKTHMEQALGELSESIDGADTFTDAFVQAKDKSASYRLAEVQLRGFNEGMRQYSTTLNTPVTGQEWGEELSQKIVWFTGRNIQAAEMHLNPAELGPIDVKIQVNNDVASLTFNVNNASVRDLLESSVIRLREMIESNGMNLGDVNIDSGKQDQQAESGGAGQGFGSGSQSANEDEQTTLNETEITVKQNNLVDYFV